jgi:D-ribose pyranase
METVDVALLPNVPTIMQVIEAIQLEVPIEAVYLAEEIKVQAPDILEAYRAHFPDIEFQFLPHVPDFDQLVGTCKGAVRSGQFYRHAPNCVLKIGCVY